jgi:hypothetical protein
MLRARREEDFVSTVGTSDVGPMRNGLPLRPGAPNAAGLRSALVSRGASD